VLGITGEYLDRGRSNRAEEGNPRIIGDTKTKNKTVYVNGEFPVGPGKLYLTAGAQDRDASSAAFARGGVGSDDIPSRNSAAMYPDGFVPFIDAAVDDRYGTSASAPASASGPATSRRPTATTACATPSRTR
jgi:iron complex outermembrane receptor protein